MFIFRSCITFKHSNGIWNHLWLAFIVCNQDASEARRELVVRWISTVGNYDYMFDWVFSQNGVIGINA
ncbi:hypothetical protein, partial [Acinetobacter baumannii]|uniref:copper amine oxidase n=1 Tax=Acinetobacter baumannii TaxID=470 RepID=UPI001CB7F9B0